MQHSELVSVIMGVRYLRDDLSPLRRAIDSILQQSYSNLELLICENDSTDEAKSVLARYAQVDSRVHLIDGSGAFLLGEKLNRCIAAAKGKWIARQDDDDQSLPERLEKQLSFLQKHTQYAFVGCNVKVEQDTIIVGIRHFPSVPKIKDFLFVQPFIHPTLVFHRNCLKAVGGYSTSPYCHGCEDYDLLLRLYQAGYCGANLLQPYFIYHVPFSGSHTRSFSMRVNEVITRWKRFYSLGLLPGAVPYVVKPILVGLIPQRLLRKLKILHHATAIKKEDLNE